MIPRVALLSRKHLNVPLNWKLNHLELLMLVDKQGKNYGLIDLDYYKKLGLLLQNRTNMSTSGLQDSLRHLLVILCPMTVVNGHSEQLLPDQRKTTILSGK